MKVMNLYKVVLTFKSVFKIPDDWREYTEKIKNSRGLYIVAKNTDIRELKNFPLIIYGKKGGLK